MFAVSEALIQRCLPLLPQKYQLMCQQGRLMHEVSGQAFCFNVTLMMCITHCLQALPDEIKDLYADPASVYNFGWSHGVERMVNGQPDRHKGSYYANPLVDVPTTDETLMKQYPAYCRPNIWPTQHLPQFQPAFQ